MSIQAVAWALEQDMPARPKLVLVAIANHASHTDGYCWLRADTIAREASCSPRAVFNFVGALIRNGYLRKSQRRGDDGRQRANDYWLLLDRAEAEWLGAGDAADISEPDEIETQDVVEPDAHRACGETDVEAPTPPVDKPAGAVGPHAPVCSHSESVEPSESKSEKDARERSRFAAPPRSYHPPPEPAPQPQGAIIADRSAKQIFVYAGTPAYEAWSRHMARVNRTRSWSLTTTVVQDGKVSTGWYFPSLFPPNETGPPSHSDPPKESDQHHIARQGT